MNTLCEDVINLFFQLLPFHAKSFALTNKYCYNTFIKYKKYYTEGNYILSPLQLRIINDLKKRYISPIDVEDKNKSLIVQAAMSTGKTAIMLAFAMGRPGTTVIIVPPSILPHWQNEITKMYGLTTAAIDICIIHANYYRQFVTTQEYNICRSSRYNPASIGRKIVIITSSMNINIQKALEHSLVIEDEIHKRGGDHRIKHFNFIGFTASKCKGWSDDADCWCYTQEEELPTLNIENVIHRGPEKMGNSLTYLITRLYKMNKGPLLIIGHNDCRQRCTNHLTMSYIMYDRKPETLKKINSLHDDSVVFLDPTLDSVGLNFTTIQTVIFIYPTDHAITTYLQALGRVQRVTSKHHQIKVIEIHENVANHLLCTTFKNENEIISYAKQHRLTILKSIRNKSFLLNIFKLLVTKFDIKILFSIDPILFTMLTRIPKVQFKFVCDKLKESLNMTEDQLRRCFEYSQHPEYYNRMKPNYIKHIFIN